MTAVPRNNYNAHTTTLMSSLTSGTQTANIMLNALIRNSAVVAWAATAGGILRFHRGNLEEHVLYTSATLDSSNNVTLVGVTRALPWNTNSFTTAGDGIAWPAGTTVDLVLDARHMGDMAFQSLANTFTDNQTISDSNKLFFGGTGVWTRGDGGTEIYFKSTTTAEKSLATLAAAAGTDEKVKNSINDTTSSYLTTKLLAGNGVTLTTANPSGNETSTVATKGTFTGATGGTKTIASGVITITSAGYYLVDTEAAATGDDLVTISGGTDGQIIWLGSANVTRVVNIKGLDGNIFLSAADEDYTLGYGFTPFINLSGAIWFPAWPMESGSIPGTMKPWTTSTAPSGHLLCFGQAVSRTTYSNLFEAIVPNKGTVTVTIASPGVFSKTSHGLVAGDPIFLTTTGALPTGLSANTLYYVISAGLTANAFEVSATIGGSAVNTSGSQSGTHTLFKCSFGLGDGSTTFNIPDSRGRNFLGWDLMGGGSATARVTSPTGASIGEVAGGNEKHTILTQEIPAALGIRSGNANGAGGSSGTYLDVDGGGAVAIKTGNYDSASGGTNNPAPNIFSTSNTPADTPFSLMNPYLTLSAIIKY